METQIQPIQIDEVRNKEEVRIYRLHMLEENQVKILNKIEELEQKIEENFTEKVKDHERRISLLEKGFNNYERFKWAVIGETLVIIGLLFKSIILGV